MSWPPSTATRSPATPSCRWPAATRSPSWPRTREAEMRVPEAARLVRIPLEGTLSGAAGALLVRGDALVGSEPLVVATPDEDPFDLLDRQPLVEDPGGQPAGGQPAGGQPAGG